MPDNSRYFTVREAATYLRKGEAAMRAHANATDPDLFIPAIKDGRKIIFDRDDLDAYMARKKDS